jgi:hypothetical protein
MGVTMSYIVSVCCELYAAIGGLSSVNCVRML